MVFGVLGVFLSVTASVGVLSVDLATCGAGVVVFGCYHALMLVLFMLQLAALVFYHTDSVQRHRPHTGPGSCALK